MAAAGHPLVAPLFEDAVLSLDLCLGLVLVVVLSLAPLAPRVLAVLGRSRPSHRVDDKPRPAPLPHVAAAIPWIGHALGLRRRGARYIHDLIVRTPAPAFTIDILSKRAVVLHPAVDRALARHVDDTSLARIVSIIGQRSLGLSDRAVATISEHDPRPIHAQLFAASGGAASLADASAAYIAERTGRQPAVQEVALGRWVFDLVVGASAHALWGAQNPWSKDDEFMRQFIILSDSLESLNQPLPWLTARRAYQAREFLVARLRSFHAEHRASRARSMAHRINAVAIRDEGWEANDDYYRCELLEALGLLATASTLSVWLVRHLLADDALRRAAVAEVRRLDADGGRLDAGAVRAACPHLVAAWYETLRLHVTAVPRVATRDFDLDVGPAPAARIREGDVLLLPMLSFNTDPQTWGPTAASFCPGRFLDAQGRLLAARTRRVRGFGVAGNLCPGRAFGFDTAMAAAAALLRGFDVERAAGPGTAFAPPTPMAAANVGFERLGDDVQARLTRVSAGR